MKVFINSIRQALALAIIVALSAVFAMGQGRASLRGVIKDEFGAIIVGATVTLADQNAAEKTTTTNGQGEYVFSGLAPGKYSVRATATGFAVSDEAEVELAAGQRATQDITLKSHH